MNIAVLNGPNINFIGIREPHIYGTDTYKDLEKIIREHCADKDIGVEIYQSNHEGALVDKIQECYGKVDGIIINPGAYTHTSIAILDALKAVNIPAVEVHLSNVSKREPFRQISYIRNYCKKTITGKGIRGYIEAIDFLNNLNNNI
ncbi:MAG: type II 3-dehydroquinate dehydratase [Clostridiales bacterium]|nr:type II 3-dehydroquinate dehydratase [Clostridiales bacterium]